MKGMEIDAAAAKVARRGILLLDDLRTVGVSDKAAERRADAVVWERRSTGLYVINAFLHDWWPDLLAAQLGAGPHATAAGLSSPALWRVPGFPEGPIDISSRVGFN